MKIELQNVNTNKLHDELIKASIIPELIESLDNTTWVTVDDSQYDAVMAVVAVHNPTTPSIVDIKNELAELDKALSRETEDTWTAIALDTTKLSQIVQDRLKRKQDLRIQLQNLIL
jgi:hypothetical protein